MIDKIRKVLELAKTGHRGQFRNDGKTPYINHPIEVCRKLYDFGFTAHKMEDDDVDFSEFNYYAVALMHDLLEDTNITKQQIIEVSSETIYDYIELLTFKKDENNPFAKTGYLVRIADSYDDLLIAIKCIDRICNVYDFIKDGNVKYAKKYFHKADCLWNAVYYRDFRKFEKLWKEILKLNSKFHNNLVV